MRLLASRDKWAVVFSSDRLSETTPTPRQNTPVLTNRASLKTSWDNITCASIWTCKDCAPPSHPSSLGPTLQNQRNFLNFGGKDHQTSAVTFESWAGGCLPAARHLQHSTIVISLLPLVWPCRPSREETPSSMASWAPRHSVRPSATPACGRRARQKMQGPCRARTRSKRLERLPPCTCAATHSSGNPRFSNTPASGNAAR